MDLQIAPTRNIIVHNVLCTCSTNPLPVLFSAMSLSAQTLTSVIFMQKCCLYWYGLWSTDRICFLQTRRRQQNSLYDAFLKKLCDLSEQRLYPYRESGRECETGKEIRVEKLSFYVLFYVMCVIPFFGEVLRVSCLNFLFINCLVLLSGSLL